MTRTRWILTLLTASCLSWVASIFLYPEPMFAGRPVRAWVTDLSSTDYAVRHQALETVKEMGALCVPALIDSLEATDPPFRTFIERLGGRLGRDWKRPDGSSLRRSAALALPDIGAHATPALKPLVDVLDDESPRVAEDAERALIRLRAYSIGHLFIALDDRRDEVRRRALRALTEINPGEANLAAVVIGLLTDKAASVREEAARSLGILHREPQQSAAGLMQRLSDECEPVRAAAADALAMIGPASGVDISLLKPALRDPSPRVRVRAAKAVWKIAGKAEIGLAVLTEGLNHPGVAFEAAFTLADMGPKAAPAIPALVAALKRERVPRPFRTAPSSVFALGKIGPAAVPRLIETLEDPNAVTRCSAALALGIMKEKAGPAKDALTEALHDSSEAVRHASVVALIHLDATGPTFQAALEEMLRAEDIFLRTVAVDALRDLAPDRDWFAQPE